MKRAWRKSIAAKCSRTKPSARGSAANDLDHIADYLFEHTPLRAPELVRAVYLAPATLLTFPNRGRLARKTGPASRANPCD